MRESYPVKVQFPDRGHHDHGQVRFYPGFAELLMADGARHELPYAHAQLAYGGRRDHQAMLTLVARQGEVMRIYFDGLGVFQAPPEAWPPELRERARALTTRRRWVWAIVPGIVAFFAAGWLLLQGFVAAAVWLVPASAEVSVGKVFADSTAAEHVVADKLLADTTQLIGTALVAQAGDQPYPFVFRVVDLPMVNALAFPGGQVLVTAKLIAKAESADELAAVLGHEVVHVLDRHVTKQLAQNLGLAAALTLLLGDVGTAGTLAASYGSELVSLSYGRGQEAAADRAGGKLAHAAGFDPRGLDAFFKRLEAEHGDGGPALLSSHPAHADRIAAIAALAKELGPVKPGARPRLAAWKDVQARAAGLGTKPENKARPLGKPAL